LNSCPKAITKKTRKNAILTVSTPAANYIDAALKITKEDAAKYFRDLLSEFCFYTEDKERAISVVLAAMLTVFCRILLGPKVQKPAFIYTANAEGAGKTLLAKLAIIPQLGFCPTQSVPENEDEFRKRMFACALADSPVLLLDNVKGHLSSGALEAFLTSSIVSDRILGASRLMDLEHNSVTFITGNSATYSADLRRRSLTVELFLEEMQSEDREIAHPLSDSVIYEKRTEILANLWALVRAWIDASRPSASITHPSFLQWSRVIGAIVEHAGFASPCTKPHTELSGDADTKDMATLVDTMNPGKQFTFSEIVSFCQTYDLFGGLVPDSGELDPSQKSKFGKLLRRYNGRVLNRKLKFLIQGQTHNSRRFVVQDLGAK
jgi:hypothetical protein